MILLSLHLLLILLLLLTLLLSALSLVVSILIIILVLAGLLEVFIETLAVCSEGSLKGARRLLSDPLSALEFISAVSSGVANSMAIALYWYDEDVSDSFRNAFGGFMSIACFLAWIRVFELVRGWPTIGFYSQLVFQAFYDIRYFLALLIVSIVAFATAVKPLIRDNHGESGSESQYAWDTILVNSFFWYSMGSDEVHSLNSTESMRVPWIGEFGSEKSEERGRKVAHFDPPPPPSLLSTF